MSTPLAPGARLRSAVCSTEVIVVRVDDPLAHVECGGKPMQLMPGAAEATSAPAPGFDTGSLLGKRYGGSGEPVELLCTKPGAGTLSVDGVILAERQAKALPASD